MYVQGIQYVPVEVSTVESQPKTKSGSKSAAKQPRVENSDTLQDKTAPRPMDIDEAFWAEEPAEEPVTPATEKKVRQPASPSQQTSHISQSQRIYIEEFIPKVGSYLHCLLDSEGVPETTVCQSCKSAPFEWRCSDCFPAPILCKECCRKLHQRLPFHRVQRWAGKYFIPSWLQEVGVRLQFGHSGEPCPNDAVRHQNFYALDSFKNAITDGFRIWGRMQKQ